MNKLLRHLEAAANGLDHIGEDELANVVDKVIASVGRKMVIAGMSKTSQEFTEFTKMPRRRDESTKMPYDLKLRDGSSISTPGATPNSATSVPSLGKTPGPAAAPAPIDPAAQQREAENADLLKLIQIARQKALSGDQHAVAAITKFAKDYAGVDYSTPSPKSPYPGLVDPGRSARLSNLLNTALNEAAAGGQRAANALKNFAADYAGVSYATPKGQPFQTQATFGETVDPSTISGT